ncbi:TPA: bacteriocin immunity protein [Streptococcus agalactiae]
MKKECRDFYRQIQHTYNDIAVREDAVLSSILSSILLSASNGLIKTSDVPRVAYELTQQLENNEIEKSFESLATVKELKKSAKKLSERYEQNKVTTGLLSKVFGNH